MGHVSRTEDGRMQTAQESAASGWYSRTLSISTIHSFPVTVVVMSLLSNR